MSPFTAQFRLYCGGTSISMPTTLQYQNVAPEVLQPLYDMNKLLAKSGLEPTLLTLVELRASQLNRCAFCLALHTREAHALGEGGDRLSGLVAWREAPWYSARERAALEWTEALTLIAHQPPGADLLARMKENFSDKELVYLTLAVNAINSWNRFNVAFGTSPEYADAVFKQLHPNGTAV
jgi:AhpD family alkylhydroperoxidase